MQEEKIWTWKELCKYYNFTNLINRKKDRENLFLSRGIIIKKLDTYINGHVACYKVDDDSIFYEDWKDCIDYNIYEVSKQGHIREKTTKILRGTLNKADGYIMVRPNIHKAGLRVHRLILNTFNHIEDSEKYVADHVNGVRTDNRLENLRWATIKENLQYKTENRKKINETLQKLIQEYGYDEIYQYLLEYEQKRKPKA